MAGEDRAGQRRADLIGDEFLGLLEQPAQGFGFQLSRGAGHPLGGAGLDQAIEMRGPQPAGEALVHHQRAALGGQQDVGRVVVAHLDRAQQLLGAGSLGAGEVLHPLAQNGYQLAGGRFLLLVGDARGGQLPAVAAGGLLGDQQPDSQVDVLGVRGLFEAAQPGNVRENRLVAPARQHQQAAGPRGRAGQPGHLRVEQFQRADGLPVGPRGRPQAVVGAAGEQRPGAGQGGAGAQLGEPPPGIQQLGLHPGKHLQLPPGLAVRSDNPDVAPVDPRQPRGVHGDLLLLRLGPRAGLLQRRDRLAVRQPEETLHLLHRGPGKLSQNPVAIVTLEQLECVHAICLPGLPSSIKPW
jgi:hypothetical protein